MEWGKGKEVGNSEKGRVGAGGRGRGTGDNSNTYSQTQSPPVIDAISVSINAVSQKKTIHYNIVHNFAKC